MKAVSFVGRSGSGKTTLIERLIALMNRQGFTVSALKHAHCGFDIDRPGKDSFRLRQAGASQVMIAGPERWALMTELRGPEPPLRQLLDQMSPCDLVLVEGFRGEGSVARIEVRSSAQAQGAQADKPWVATDDPNLIAVVCDDPIDVALPRFMRDDVAAVAQFIVQRLGMER
jgi:molybdopterin-guanine dinucleotide biosynthesis protein MobB